MGINFKDIHIGSLIQQSVLENNVKISRIRNFLKCSEEDVTNMYQSKSLDAELLLHWSKLLEYDFFLGYTHSI